MKDFLNIGLPEELLLSLNRMQYHTPTPIQISAIPTALSGRDILGSAQTGTGKTAAFGIPLVANLIRNPASCALILTPTRELATQVMEVMRKLLGDYKKIPSALLIGGDPIFRQFAQLRARPRLIIGTPGRVNDHLKRQTLKLNDFQYLVLDETDRMLDMGFGLEIDRIIQFLPKTRQTLMFSATLPKEIIQRSQKYLINPERIKVGEIGLPAIKVKQEAVYTSAANKYLELQNQLDQRQGSIIVFVKTKRSCEVLADKLIRENFEASAIHGDLRQRQREKVIREFRNKQYRILVATDVAARGLDIPHIEHVINYDLPQSPEDYVHRIGRTARAGKEGSALCLVVGAERKKWEDIQSFLNKDPNTETSQPKSGKKFFNKNSNASRRRPRRFSRKNY